MKKFLFVVYSLCSLSGLIAQTTYNFSANSTTYAPITGSNIIGANTDDYVSGDIPIGFSFSFGGCTPNVYDVFRVSTNGFVSLGNTLTGPVPNNNLNLLGQGPIIAPLWDNLSTDVNGSIQYITTGTAGNLIFTVEWKSMKWSSSALGNVISFQLKLFQVDNHIEFIYSQGASNTATPSASIGLSGGNVSGDFYSLTNSGSAPGFNRGTETSTISSKPATGQRYIFTPSTITTSINSTTQVSCFGESNGSINTSSNGGFGSLTYSWNNSATTPTISGLTAGNYTLTVSDQSGCSKNISQTVTQPTVISPNAGSDQTICLGSSANLNATASGGTPPFSYAWSPTQGLSNPNIYNPVATPTVTTNYILTVTDGNGCSASDQVSITVNTAIADAGPDKSFCAGQSVSIGSSPSGGHTYAWSPTNGLSASNVSNPTLTLSSAGIYTYTVTATNTIGCTFSDNVVITVNQYPTTPNAGPDQNLCNGSTATLAGNTLTTGTGLWSIVTGSATISNPSSPTSGLSGLTAGSAVELKWTATNAGCVLEDNVIINNSALPTTANAGTDIKVCNLTSANLSANSPSVGSAIWSIISGTGTITNPSSPTSSITGLTIGSSVTARWTISNGACASSTDDVVILAATLPTIVGSASPYNICSGGTSNLNASASGGSGSGYIYNWSPVTGLSSTNTSNPSTSVTSNIIYTVTVTDGNNCSKNDTVNISVKPLPTVNTISNQSVCSSSNFSPITFSGTAGSIFNWTNSNTGIGLASTGSGNINSFTGTNLNNSPISGTVNVTPLLNGCSGSPKSFVLTVNPQVNVTGGATSTTVCSGSTINTFVFTSNVSGATFNWTNSNTAIGLASTGSGNINSFVASNNTINEITSNLTVTASALGCTSAASPFTITVKAKPTVDSVSNQSVCSNNSFSNVTFSGAVSGTTYNWTNNNTSIGLGSSGSGNINSFTSINNGTSDITAIISITPLSGGCSGNSRNFSLTSKPLPIISSLSNQQYCAGETTTNNTFSSNLVGTTYSWFNSNIETGLSSSGNGDILPFIASNSGITNANITSTITITPSFNGCSGNNTSFTLSVAPQVNVDAGTDKSICESEISFSLEGSSAGSSSVAWTSGGNGSFSPDTTSTNPLYVLGSNDIANGSVTLYLTAYGIGNCPSVSDSIILSIDKLPTVASAGADQVLCDDTTLVMSANSPSIFTSAVWSVASGPVVNANDYSQPNTLFTGLVKGSTSVLVWGITNGICPVSYDSVTITVIDGPRINLGADTSICSGSSLTLTPTNNGSTLSWSTGETSSSINVSPNAATTYYLYASKNGCNKTDSILVNYSPEINITLINKSDSLNCFGDTTGFINVSVSGGAQPSSSLQYQWNNNQNSINLNNIQGGSYNLTVTDNLGCSKTSPNYIIYEPNPISVSLLPSGDLNCLNSSVTINSSISGGTSPYNYTWSTSENTSDISVVNPGTYDLTITDSNGCSASKSTIINQINNINYTYQLSNENCNNSDATLNINANGGSGTLAIITEDSQNTFSLVNLSSGYYSFSITDNQGCTLNDSILIEKQGLININVNAQISSSPLTDGVVYLYQTQDTGAFAIIDTISFNGNQTATFTQVNPAYNYIVGVAANNNLYPHAVLTFNGNVYRWQQSPPLTGLCNGPDLNTNIQIINQIPQLGGATISGQVIDATDTSGSRRPGEPIRGIDIILEDNPGGQINMRTQTDSNGVYSFNNVPSRSYTIYVNIPGCDMISTYTLSVDSTSQVFEKNFYTDSLAGTIDTTSTVKEAICNYNFAYSVIPGCTNEPTNFLNQSTNLTLSNFSFSWDFENDGIIDDFTKGDNLITFNQPGTYTTKIKIESNNTVCKDSVILTFNINAKPSLNAGSDIAVCENGSAQISLTTDANNFSWSTTSLLNNPSSLNTSIKTNVDTSLLLIVTAYNSSGCFNLDTLSITIYPLPVVSLNLNYDSACYGGGVITLSGENPTGGIFTATGLTGNLFDPVVAGLGTQTINYTVIDANNCISSVSDQLNVVICTSIKEELSGLINIYPNPGNGFARVENSLESSIEIYIYDVNGKVKLRENINANGYIDINTTDYPKGVYFIRIQKGVSIYSDKLIIE